MCLGPYKIIVILIFQIYETLFLRLYNCCNTLSFFMSNLLLNHHHHHLGEPQHYIFPICHFILFYSIPLDSIRFHSIPFFLKREHHSQLPSNCIFRRVDIVNILYIFTEFSEIQSHNLQL